MTGLRSQQWPRCRHPELGPTHEWHGPVTTFEVDQLLGASQHHEGQVQPVTVREIAAAVAAGDALSRELDDDAVGVWKVAWHLRRALPSVPDAQLQELAEGVLRGLGESAVAVGELDDLGVFHEWERDRGIDQAMARWRELGRDPNIGEVAWLARLR